MQKIVDYLSWGFIAIFALPTVLIMASWNSLPGESLYGVKRTFEDVLLLIAKPSYKAEASLNVQYTQRRMGEVKVLLAKDNSSEGLAQLSQQIRATKQVIERAPNKEVQKEVAKQYISTLRNVSSQLQSASAPSGVLPTARPLPTRRIYPTYTPYPTRSPNQQQETQPPQQTPEPTPVPEEQNTTPNNVSDVQQQIDQTINDLVQITSATTESVTPTEEPTAQPTVPPQPTAEPTQTQQQQNIQQMQQKLEDQQNNNQNNSNNNNNQEQQNNH